MKSFCRDLDLDESRYYGWHTLSYVKYSRKRLGLNFTSIDLRLYPHDCSQGAL